MSVEFDVADNMLGLGGTFPRPGWVVLDAVRDHRFTGEVVFGTMPEIRVYADRGRIYLAERSSDPSLGARLVDAGALNATQLEHGSLRIGDAEHLGRLFERVPSVDRHAVLVTAEMMTDECVGWLAPQRVSGVAVTPYRHHPSGAHRWDRAFLSPDVAPGDPLPAPAPDEAPLDASPPEPLFRSPEPVDADDMIRWNEPSWLDERLTIDVAGRLAALRAADDVDEVAIEPLTVTIADDSPATVPPSNGDAHTDDGQVDGQVDHSGTGDTTHDWIDHLDSAGLPDPGSDPLASPVRLAQLPAEPMDRFELIWPSGDVDEQFGAKITGPFPHPDMDRAGPTARPARFNAGRGQVDVVTEPEIVDFRRPPRRSAIQPSSRTRSSAGSPPTTRRSRSPTRSCWPSAAPSPRSRPDRSLPVAGSSTSPPPSSPQRGRKPGRRHFRVESAVRSDAVEMVTPAGRSTGVPGSSVFDNLPLIEAAPVTSDNQAPTINHDEQAGRGETHRSSALRRLIGSMRRR